MITFRFDDVSVNTDSRKLLQMLDFLVKFKLKGEPLEIILAISPMVHSCATGGLENERVFPPLFHTESDYRVFYRPDEIGVPVVAEQARSIYAATLAGHGLIHVDHRLLPRPVQELSIVTGCASVKSTLFVPPFHKWNRDTEAICDEHGLTLLKYGPQWRHLKYHKFDPGRHHQYVDPGHTRYYLHPHDFTFNEFCSRFP